MDKGEKGQERNFRIELGTHTNIYTYTYKYIYIHIHIYIYIYIQTRILNIPIKNFKRFRNVRKSIETSGDVASQYFDPSHFCEYQKSYVNPLQSGPELTPWDLGVLSTTCFYAFSDIPKSLKIFNGNFYYSSFFFTY